MIADYHRGQSLVETLLGNIVERLFLTDWRRQKPVIASTPCTTSSAVKRSWRMPMPSGLSLPLAFGMNTRLDRLRSVCLLPERKRQFGQPPLHPIRFVRHKGAKGRVKLAATKRTVNFSS
jgi:hypothetical protein